MNQPSMESSETSSASTASLLSDGLMHPWKKWLWWLLIAACVAALLWFALYFSPGRRGGGRGMYAIAALLAIIVRCYFSVMETTLTGYGESPHEGSGLRMDEFWETLGRVVVAALIAWFPVALVALYLNQSSMPMEPWVSIFAALGCEYFPMALLGIVNFGGLRGAAPQVVLPAILKCGPIYMLSGLGLLLVPYSANWTYHAFPRGGAWAVIAASSAAAYFLIAHARLTARIYLANSERLGW
ncbi:MAG: hypothetical protein ACAH88_14220 [Roseimicrobium sp.]